MKKILFILATITICFASACKKNTSPTVENQQGEPEKKETVLPGKYKGILPTASGNGMEVTVSLTDSTYKKEVLYIGKPGLFVSEGKYSYNPENTIVTLEVKKQKAKDAKEEPNQYIIKGDSLIQLDINGNVITGNMANYYILLRQ